MKKILIISILFLLFVNQSYAAEVGSYSFPPKWIQGLNEYAPNNVQGYLDVTVGTFESFDRGVVFCGTI
tara:strand:+ start:302 stop:508 length:207 start_codon:yes stop_codon:yes gene_type:complete